MKWPRCYLRTVDSPFYSQDHPTYILLGRFARMYNAQFKLWFFVAAPELSLADLRRPNCLITRVSWSEFRKVAGKRLWRHLFEDFLGVRFCTLAKRSRFAWVRKLLKSYAYEDACQDFEEYNRSEQPIRVNCHG